MTAKETKRPSLNVAHKVHLDPVAHLDLLSYTAKTCPSMSVKTMTSVWWEDRLTGRAKWNFAMEELGPQCAELS